MSFDLVAFDMDGVLLSCRSSWQLIHDKLGTDNSDDLHAYIEGEIDDAEFIRRDVSRWLAKGARTKRDLEEMLSGAPRVDGLVETINSLRGRMKTAIVSAGLDLIADRIAHESGMDYVMANGLEFDDQEVLTGEGLVRVPLRDKGGPFLDLCGSVGIDPRRAVAIGNSRFDVPMLVEAGLGIAFNPVDDEIRENSDFVVVGTMTGILPILYEHGKRRI